MKRTKQASAVAAVALSLAFAACSGTGNDNIELSGAGATFPLPYYTQTFSNFQKSDSIAISYGGIGSGGGIRSLKDQIVDFAATDAFLSDEEMQQMQPVVHVPTCMGAVVLAYKLDGVDSLRLDGKTIAGIFGGKITKWNDPQLAAINPGVQLPDLAIAPVFRADGSGTTYVFTNYLSKADSEWDAAYGCAKTVNFPCGQAAKGNPGVAGIIGNTNGAIGYIGSEYAFAQKLKVASVGNKNGEFVAPTTQSISLAAQDGIPADTRTMITDSATPGAYPISCLTWIVVYTEQNYAGRSPEQAQATVRLLKFMLSPEQQAQTSAVHYAPLPQRMIETSLANIGTLTYNGNKIN